MRLRERFGNGKAETESAETPLQGLIALFEGVENAVDDFFLHPDSGIAHFHLQHLRPGIARVDDNLAPFGSELDRILEQVPNDLLKLRRIGRDVTRARLEVEMHAELA